MIIANGLVGLWALAAARWEVLTRPALWWATGLAWVLTFAQVGSGAWLIGVADRSEPAPLHAFYGFLTIVAIAIVFSYRAQLQHRLHLLYGGGGLFIMGLALRALTLR